MPTFFGISMIAIVKTGGKQYKVKIGQVLKVEKHSNSDHLSLCDVDIGDKDSIQIVCGAPNVKNGIYVPVALVGASLDNGNFKIKFD